VNGTHGKKHLVTASLREIVLNLVLLSHKLWSSFMALVYCLHLASTIYFSLMLFTTPIFIPEISPPYFSVSFLGSRTCRRKINSHLRDANVHNTRRKYTTTLESRLRETIRKQATV
jgi:hypothetical protein